MASHEIAFSTNHSERVLLRQQCTPTLEYPISSLATKVTPLGFHFRAGEGKDGLPPLRPNSPHRVLRRTRPTSLCLSHSPLQPTHRLRLRLALRLAPV